MSRIFKQIVESDIEPNKENIWLYKDSLYYYNNGKWRLINDKSSLNNSQDKEEITLMNYSLIGG